MRKLLLILAAALLLAVCASASADTDFSLAPCPARVTLKDSLLKNCTLLTPDNLAEHADLVNANGMSRSADLAAEWEARGVLMQLWTPLKSKYKCLEITVIQDDQSAQYFDLIHSGTKENWKDYAASYRNSDEWTGKGYTFQSWETKSAQSNGYLLLKYLRTTDAGSYRGYMARTVYQGYTVVLDMQVYNQLPVSQDATALYNILRSFTADAGIPAGSASAGTEEATDGSSNGAEGAAQTSGSVPLTITQGPPLETNTNTFTVEGTTAPGAHLIGVLMRITSDEPLRFETDAHARTGAFKMKVTIPEDQENVWLMTLNVLENDQVVAEKVFETTTYKKTLIPVVFDAEVPEYVISDELVISGTTIKGVQIQCLVTSPTATWAPKTSTPNGTGRFTFKLATKDEGEYDIALVFSKKNMETKRFEYTVTRNLSEDARKARTRKEALRISYSTMAARIDQYVGKTMTYSAWVTGIEQAGDEWMITAAGAKTGDHYSQTMIFLADEEPSFAVEEKHTFFGTCIGPYQTQSEEGTEYIPSFDLLFWD